MSEHLHVHVVPRWTGDANFMTAVANTRTLPEPLVDTASQAAAGLAGAGRLRRTMDRLPPRVGAISRTTTSATCSPTISTPMPQPSPAAYRFPDNSRRRIPGGIYLGLAVICLVVYLTARVVAAGQRRLGRGRRSVLGAFGLFSLTSGWRMKVDEKQALVAAQQAIGFPVGHASAQQVWHGVRSRPTWRVLCYSAEEPPQPPRLRARRRRRRTRDPAPRGGQPRGMGGGPLMVFDGKFRAPVDAAVKPLGAALRKTKLTPDHLTIVGLLVGAGVRGCRRRRPSPLGARARHPGGPARPARRCAREGVEHVEPARRVLRLDRRPSHRRAAAGRHRLLLRRDPTIRASPCCRSPCRPCRR